MQKLFILLILVIEAVAKPVWKQVPGSGEPIDDFFSRHPTADVIWGYDNGLWHVACRKSCPELSKYPDLKKMVHQQGYWVRNLQETNTATQNSMAGTWDMQMFSTGPFDAVTGTITISSDGSAAMTGHAMLLAQLGLNQNKRPISAFEINHIEIANESILVMHYTFFEEAVKPKDIPEDYIVPQYMESTRKGVTTTYLLGMVTDYEKLNQYLEMGYVLYPKTTPACRFSLNYWPMTPSGTISLKTPEYTLPPSSSPRTRSANTVSSSGGPLPSGFASELLSAEILAAYGVMPNISCDAQINHYKFLPVPGKMYHPITRRTQDSITLQLQTHKNYWVDSEPRHGSDLVVLTKRTSADSD